MGTTTILRNYHKRIVLTGAGINAETLAWKNAVIGAGGSVSDTQLGYVDTFNTAIKAASIRLDRAWLMSGMENATQATYDVIAAQAHTFNGTGSFSARWTQANGFTGNGTDNYLNSNFNPRTAAGFYAVNDCMACNHINNARSSFSTGMAIGAGDGTDFVQMLAFYTSGPNMSVNASGAILPTLSDSQCIMICSRTGSTATKGYGYKSATASTATDATASVSPILNQPIFIGAYNNNGSASFFTADAIGAAIMGGGVDDTKADALAAALNAFMTSGGATFHY